MAQRPDTPDSKMDAATLYREEIITDRKVGTIRRMTPITSDGADDSTRPTVYLGEAQIMTNAGPLPINFEIEAAGLAEAVEKFGDAAKEALTLMADLYDSGIADPKQTYDSAQQAWLGGDVSPEGTVPQAPGANGAGTVAAMAATEPIEADVAVVGAGAGLREEVEV